jgi:hypothetical protein
VQLVGVVSDIVYDTNLNKYTAADNVNNTINDVTMTDYIPVNGGAPLNVNLDATLTPNGALNDKASVVQCLGILFFEKMGTAYYPLAQGKAMKIVDIY